MRFVTQAWGQVHIPGNDDGYLIKDAKNSHQNAPSGYEGRPVANYGNPKKPSYVDDGSSSSEGTAFGESRCTVEVTLDKFSGHIR